MPSTAPTLTASLTGDDFASRTAETAQSTLRWRASAIAVILAIASFRTLSPSVPLMSSPWPPTGEAAPMLVPGAISGDVGGERDERPGAGGEPAGRGDPDDDRDLRLEQRPDDVVGGEEAAAGRVELDHHGGCAVALGPGDPVRQVARHPLVDDAGRGQDDDLAPRAASAGREEEHAEQGKQDRQARRAANEVTGHGCDLQRGVSHRQRARRPRGSRRRASSTSRVDPGRRRPRRARRRRRSACPSRGWRPAARRRRPGRRHPGGRRPPRSCRR